MCPSCSSAISSTEPLRLKGQLLINLWYGVAHSLAANIVILHVLVGCPATWTVQDETTRQGGFSASASTVQECRTACNQNASCTAVDWIPSASRGQNCWLHGSWSSGDVGVQHHAINRTCGQWLILFIRLSSSSARFLLFIPRHLKRYSTIR